MQLDAEHVSPNEFEEAYIDTLYHPFLRLKEKYLALRGTWDKLLEAPNARLRNSVCYDIYVEALDGWMIHLSEFGRVLLESLESIKHRHRRSFRRNKWKDISVDPGKFAQIGTGPRLDVETLRRDIAIPATQQDRDRFKNLWDTYFPSTRSREKGVPSDSDIDKLKAEIENIGQPIRDHRNTVAAHRYGDTEGLGATWDDVAEAVSGIERILKDLYFLSTSAQLIFDAPRAREAEKTAKVLAEEIIGKAEAT